MVRVAGNVSGMGLELMKRYFPGVFSSTWVLGVLTVIVMAAALRVPAAKAGEASVPNKPAELYQPTKVWTVHLRLTPEEWEAMEPKGGGSGGFGRGPGGPGGPGGPLGGGAGAGRCRGGGGWGRGCSWGRRSWRWGTGTRTGGWRRRSSTGWRRGGSGPGTRRGVGRS